MKQLLSLLAILFTMGAHAQLQVQLSFSDSLKAVPQQGRVLLYFNKGDEQPIFSVQPGELECGIRFGQDVDWQHKPVLQLGKELQGFPAASLQSLEAGTYSVQAIYRVDTSSYRLFVAPNYYSDVQRVVITKGNKQPIKLKLLKQFSPRRFTDSKYARYVSVKSELLSRFWHRDVTIHACVGLPYNYDSSGSSRYPVSYLIGGYGSTCNYFSYLYADSNVMKRHNAGQDANLLDVMLDSDAPYGDSYQMNSANNGPYMTALLQELIPAVEKRFHAAGTPSSRFLTGGSTGGWVSLALQIFNPDFFGGCWSRYGDPVDFNFFQLVNLYKDKNAYVNKYGYENSSVRTIYDETKLSIRHEVAYENTLGRFNSYVFSGDQWGGWNAVYSPKGANGYPKAIWDPRTGTIDSSVAAYWKRWDLHLYLREHWPEIGPKLQGKLHIWMGDMDTYYLNNAMRLFQDFLSATENPKSDADFHFGPMQPHGYDPLGDYGIRQEMLKTFAQVH